MGILGGANRESGNWLPDVDRCQKRVLPCGNPRCADEAMRAGNIRAGSNDFLAQQQAQQAEKNSLSVARDCDPDSCPLAKATGQNVISVLRTLSGK